MGCKGRRPDHRKEGPSLGQRSEASNAVGDRLAETGLVESMSSARLGPLLWDLVMFQVWRGVEREVDLTASGWLGQT